MKKANLRVLRISVEEMLVHPAREYNPSVWEHAVRRLAQQKDCQFYIADRGNVYQYDRFYATYRTDEGLYFFNEFSAYSGCLTNNGFCKVHIDENGIVWKSFFYDAKGNEGRAANTPENRKKFALGICFQNVLISNCI